MITARELSYALFGAYRLARLDRSGMAYFDATVDGFWRSFYAGVIVAPAYAIVVMLQFGGQPIAAGEFRIFVVKAIAYVISWTAFPLLMFYIARLLDRNTQYIGFIVANNWANVLQIGLLLPATAITVAGMLPGPVGDSLPLIASLVILVYQWFIARTALEVTGGTAAWIVFIDVVIGVFIGVFANALLR